MSNDMINGRGICAVQKLKLDEKKIHEHRLLEKKKGGGEI